MFSESVKKEMEKVDTEFEEISKISEEDGYQDAFEEWEREEAIITGYKLEYEQRRTAIEAQSREDQS